MHPYKCLDCKKRWHNSLMRICLIGMRVVWMIRTPNYSECGRSMWQKWSRSNMISKLCARCLCLCSVYEYVYEYVYSIHAYAHIGTVVCLCACVYACVRLTWHFHVCEMTPFGSLYRYTIRGDMTQSQFMWLVKLWHDSSTYYMTFFNTWLTMWSGCWFT